MSQIPCYSKNECIFLFRYIFRDIIDFYRQLDPEGFSNSGYRDLLYADPDESYKEYREMHADSLERSLSFLSE